MLLNIYLLTYVLNNYHQHHHHYYYYISRQS